MRFDMLDIGARLRSLRIENNLSAGEVADEVGKSESHIMQIERGSRNITADMICKLAILYNTDTNTILGFGSMNFGSNDEIYKLSNDEKLRLHGICSEIISALVGVKEAV